MNRRSLPLRLPERVTYIAYLKLIFGFIGFTDIREIFVEPTEVAGPAAREEAVAAAKTKEAEMAANF